MENAKKNLAVEELKFKADVIYHQAEKNTQCWKKLVRVAAPSFFHNIQQLRPLRDEYFGGVASARSKKEEEQGTVVK